MGSVPGGHEGRGGGPPGAGYLVLHGPLDEITLGGDKFVVLFPGDAHAPNIAVDGPEPVRKCVVKVKL